MTITWEFVVAVLTILGAVSAVWWLVADARAALEEIRKNTDDLAAYRTHVAEQYVTKSGMAEQTAQIMSAINGVSGKLDHLSGRIDALYAPKPTNRARSG